MYILVSNVKDEEQLAAGEKLYEQMKAAGIDVLLDDRKDRFGAKIKDYELLGIPNAVVIGKNLAEGNVEIITRKGMVKEEISIEKIADVLKERV